MGAFVYRDGDVVPRDVTRVVVHPSVRVLPPNVFAGCDKLEEVRLNEGLEEIGYRAFYDCDSLGRLGCPSTVVRIGDRAFFYCAHLSTMELREGLEEIGREAFYGCVSLRRLNCPSTVVRIGDEAFGYCCDLSAVDLAGILKVERRSFLECDPLERIGIPYRAFVVRRGNANLDYTCRLVTGGSIVHTNGSIARTNDDFVLIAPGCLTTLPESKLTELGDTIDTIMNNGEGTQEDRLGRIRQTVREEVRQEVSAILGLAFWKAKIGEAGRRKGTEVDAVLIGEARKECRDAGKGKGKVIAQDVLPFLDGFW